jgi:hypothetical protein
MEEGQRIGKSKRGTDNEFSRERAVSRIDYFIFVTAVEGQNSIKK